MHLFELGRSDLFKSRAVVAALTIFNFREINLIILDRDEVDFVGFGLEIAGDDVVALLREMVSNDGFGGLAEIGSGGALGLG